MKALDLVHQVADTVRLLPQGGPSCCNIAITNVCNARCDFCNYARDKDRVGARAWMGYEDLCQALDILRDRGIRYLTFTGGEPMLHPRLLEMVAYAAYRRMRPSIVTNGWYLVPEKIERLREAGLNTVFISIDAASREAHEANRGLRGVCERISLANDRFDELGAKSVASVTISRLIGDLEELIAFLRELGFSTVTFTYPKRWLGSSSMVFSETSPLIDFDDDDLAKKLEELLRLKRRFAILNPAESIAEMIRFLRGGEQRFPCYGGYKYFLLDWNLDVYRCDFWPTPMCSIGEFRNAELIRDGCTRCMSVCYRDSSVFYHSAISFGDALRFARRGRFPTAAAALLTRANLRSLRALFAEWGTLRRLAKIEARSAAPVPQRGEPRSAATLQESGGAR
ncbi:radical SAM protein [bacterium]|nr:radical SAM protein [bacterium]